MPRLVYVVETSYRTNALCGFVNERLAKGWQLYGSISTSPYMAEGKPVIVFTQALTKEIPDEAIPT